MAACQYYLVKQPKDLARFLLLLVQGQLNQALAGVLLGCLEVTMEDVVAEAAGGFLHLQFSLTAVKHMS